MPRQSATINSSTTSSTLPPCRYVGQVNDYTRSIYCIKLDRWVSINFCRNHFPTMEDDEKWELDFQEKRRKSYR